LDIKPAKPAAPKPASVDGRDYPVLSQAAIDIVRILHPPNVPPPIKQRAPLGNFTLPEPSQREKPLPNRDFAVEQGRSLRCFDPLIAAQREKIRADVAEIQTGDHLISHLCPSARTLLQKEAKTLASFKQGRNVATEQAKQPGLKHTQTPVTEERDEPERRRTISTPQYPPWPAPDSRFYFDTDSDDQMKTKVLQRMATSSETPSAKLFEEFLQSCSDTC